MSEPSPADTSANAVDTTVASVVDIAIANAINSVMSAAIEIATKDATLLSVYGHGSSFGGGVWVSKDFYLRLEGTNISNNNAKSLDPEMGVGDK